MSELRTADVLDELFALGCSPIPVPFRSKRPIEPEWEKSRVTRDNVDEYFNGHPTNFGVLLGEPSDDLADIDLDCPEAIALAPRFLPLKAPAFGRTSKRASHYLYRARPCGATIKFYDVHPTKANGQMLAEYRSTGAQTIFPGSVHESGEPIEWDVRGMPPDIERAELLGCIRRLAAATLLVRHGADLETAELAITGAERGEIDLPDGIELSPKIAERLRRWFDIAEPTRSPEREPSGSAQGDVMRRASAYLATKDPAIQGSGGSLATFNAACDLVVGFELAPDQALELLEREFNPRCKPKWSRRELEHKVADAANKCKRPSGYLLERGRELAASNRNEPVRALADAPALVEDDLEAFADSMPGPVAPMAFARGDHVELAEALNSDLARRGQLVFAEGESYRYDSARGLWLVVELGEQSRVVQAFAGADVAIDSKPLRLKASDVAGAIKLARDRVADAEFFRHARPGLAFSNGHVSVDPRGVRLSPHSPDNRARYGYGFAYDAAAGAERWADFLVDTFRDDDDRDDKIAFLAEFFGASLLGLATRFQRAVVGIGDGANGKTTLLTIIQGCMPAGSTSAIAPQEWGQEYRRALLAGVRMNAVSELPEADIIESEAFKAIVSGDLIVGRRIREAPFSFHPIAGHFFAANRLPGTNDTTFGFWRRFIAVTFNRRFAEHEQNPRLAEELLARERAGIILWLLDGARRVLEQGRYTLPPSSTTVIAEWRKNADQVALFVDEATTPAMGEWAGTQAGRLYEAFRRWAERNGHRVMSSRKFSMRLKALGHGSEHTRRGEVYPLGLTEGGL